MKYFGCLFFGLLFIYGLFVLYDCLRNLARFIFGHRVIVDGKITGITRFNDSESSSVTINYTFENNNKIFNASQKFSGYSWNLIKGDNIKVYFNENTKFSIVSKFHFFGYIIFCLILGVFFVVIPFSALRDIMF